MQTHPFFLVVSLLSCLSFSGALRADGPGDNVAGAVRPVPPDGVTISQADRDELSKSVQELRARIDEAARAQEKNPALERLLPDVEIFHKAVDWALRHNEFFQPEEVADARSALAEGFSRAEALRGGSAPWLERKGLVVRAYRSRVDGSVQPYGMVIPPSYSGAPSRLDVWIHGRAEKLSELAFITQRSRDPGEARPDGALVLHPYGRFCCANKFAGETDLFEALAHAQTSYAIDPGRIVVRGFSMGGAAVWQFGTHFAGQWRAISPGAGFAETPEFLHVFQNEDVSGIPWYQQKLWHLYNATDYAVNLAQCPTIAYSGELDKQKQAADVMAREMQKEGLELTHLIGPQTAHKLHPDSLREIERRLASICASPTDRAPREIRFTTWTLRYPDMHWVRVKGLHEHWARARVNAKFVEGGIIEVNTENVSALTLDFDAGLSPFSPYDSVKVRLNGAEITGLSRPTSDRSWRQTFWIGADGKPEQAPGERLRKKPGLQGPIDDAFFDSFVFVEPSGTSGLAKADEWAAAELARAKREWRRQFRGDAPVVQDTAVTENDVADRNLVLWGNPASNAYLKKIADRLPVKWTEKSIVVNGITYAAEGHVPVFVFPNPENPERYVVVNSGFTYREYDYLNNARQVPKLPDWAVIDLSQPPDAVAPGKVVDAGFFNETWEWKPAP